MDKKENNKKINNKKKNIKRKKLFVFFISADAVLLIGIALLFLFQVFDFKEAAEFIFPSEFIDDIVNEAEDEQDTAVKTLTELRSSSSLSKFLKDWAVNGSGKNDTLMQSKDVLNFLLVGLDQGGGNSDVMMILSADKKNEKIYLTSLMRDSYTYINTKFGDKYAKLNAAYANGGINCLIETIQNDYKIKIDNYILVNFKTFVKIVDIIGGITLPVQKYEAKAAGLPEWGDHVSLNGNQALSFCRIRKCDSDGDVSRTRRQRQFITAVIDKCRDIKVSQIDDILDTLLEYVKTDCGTSKLISLATQGLLGKWYEFEIVSQSLPAPENRMDYSGAAWVWIVDYPSDAVYLQKLIYGKTNIELSEDRVSAIELMKSGKGGI